MCAILGLAFQRGNKIKKDQPIWDAITKLFLESQPRGRVSTGMAITNRKDTVVIKDAVSATDFVKTDAYQNALRRYLSVMGGKGSEPSPPISVIGHCRFPTKGSEYDNNNNHPIISGKLVGVHNGGIHNDEKIWKDFTLFKHRKGKVDSEAIFALIEHYLVQSHGRVGVTADAISDASSYLQGGYACAMVNTRNPYCIWLFKNTMPCVMRHYHGLGLVAWASVSQYMDRAFEDLNFGPFDEFTLESNSGIGIDLHRSQFENFKLNTPYSRSKAGFLT